MTILVHTMRDGVLQVVDVITVWYVKACPYGWPHGFKTADYRRKFCCRSHRQMFSKQHIMGGRSTHP